MTPTARPALLKRLPSVAGRVWRGLADLLYPPFCPACDAVRLPAGADGRHPSLCPGCLRQLVPVARPFCERCGQPYDGPPDDRFHCSNCAGRELAFDFAIAPYLARGTLRELIHRFKFGRTLPLRQPLGRLMARVFDDPRLAGAGGWTLVPVPIHRWRYRQRGFNQAVELAAVLSRETSLPVVPALRRVRFTPSQSRLSREERLANLDHAIAPHPRQMRRVAGRDVLLVDDVFTTGSTAQACAQVLVHNGVRKVVVITLARG